jgi:hypothetical protein
MSEPRSIGRAPTLTAREGLLRTVGSVSLPVKEVAVHCLRCNANIVVSSNKTKFTCPTGHRQEFVACQKCQAAFQIRADEKDRTVNCSACGEPWKANQVYAWDWCNYQVELRLRNKATVLTEGYDLVIRGITLAASGGSQIRNMTECLIGFGASGVTIQPEQRETPVDEIPYAEIHAVEVDGTATTRNAGIRGGGFGVAGATEGILAATVINTLTSRTIISTILRIASNSAEYVFVSDSIEAKALHMFLTPVYPRVRQAKAPTPPPTITQAPPGASSLADELSKLAKLRDDGILSDSEFAAAKARLLSQA